MHVVLALSGLAILSLPVAACGRAAYPLSSERAIAGAALPELDAEQVQKLARAAGKPVVVSLWASWCEPCVEEIATLTRFQVDHPEALVLGLATDAGDDGGQARIERVFHVHRPGYAQAAIAAGSEDAFLSAFGANWDGMLPKLLLIGPDGSPRVVVEQAVDASLLAREVVPRLGKPSATPPGGGS